jgi:predicted phosphodiesterase
MLGINFKIKIELRCKNLHSMKLQIVSDTHLEFISPMTVDLPVAAEYIALLGDIGYPKQENYEKFLSELSPKYKSVFVIAGNHEFYNSSTAFEAMVEIIEEKCSKFPNVYFLNNKSMLVEGTRIIGTTLWSHIPNEKRSEVVNSIGDYQHIRRYNYTSSGEVRKYPISIDFTNMLHSEAVYFIKHELSNAKNSNEKVVLLTHHAPMFNGTSDPKYEGEARAINYAFASKLEDLIAPPITNWCFGHTHYPTDFMFNGVRVSSNPRGYPCKEVLDFKPDFTIDF